MAVYCPVAMKFIGYDPGPVARYGQFANVGLPTVANDPPRAELRRGSYVPMVLAVGLPMPRMMVGVDEYTGANNTYLGVPTLV